MMSIFHTSKNKLLKRLTLESLCLLLSGCATWFYSEETSSSTLPNTTVVGETAPVTPEGSKVKHEKDVATQVGQPSLRALPRRPEVIQKEIYEDKDMDEDENRESITYVVQKGDTLSEIAQKFHVNIQDLLQKNHISDKNHLRIGHILTIPSNIIAVENPKCTQSFTYRVCNGDTLSHIAIRFDTTVAAIRNCNNLKSDRIRIGQNLTIPGTHNTTVKTNQPTSTQPIDTEKYVVQPGDMLWNIAKRCGMSVQQLMEINHISNPKNLRPGQVLIVKAQSKMEDFSSAGENTNSSSVSTNGENTVSQVTSNVKDVSQQEDFEDLFESEQDIPLIPLDEK